MFRSATFKLTLWYLALVMFISIIFSVVLYHVATAELARGLHHETQRLFRQYSFRDVVPPSGPGPDYSDGAHRLLMRLLGFNSIVFVGAGAASYLLARRTLEPIEQAHEQQKRFTADVSHELRTPLTALKMESEVALLNPRAGSAELRKTLQSNIEEANKLDALINNLLRLTRLEADELRQSFKKVDMKKISSEAVAQVQSLVDAKALTLSADLASAKLDGDHDSLVQLVVILLDNAIKYSPARSTVILTLKQQGEQLIAQVTDQGPGIEPEALAHVFDRFYRADASRGKAETDGFGLGLSIAKLIADIHHGHISLDSARGAGTIATLTLPTTREPLTASP